MLPTLTSLFQGSLAHFQDHILLPEQSPGDVVPARELFGRDGLDWVLGRYAEAFFEPASQPLERQPLDPRALISQWSKYFLAYAICVPVAANLLCNRQLPMVLDGLGVVLNEHGLVTALVVTDEGLPIAANNDAQARLRPLMDMLLAPAIDAMATHTGIAPRALWSNAGHYYVYLIDQLQALSVTSPAVTEGACLMTLGHFDDGKRNPLYQPVRQVRDAYGDSRCVRRICCVRYRLPGVDYCGNCPLPAALAERPVEA